MDVMIPVLCNTVIHAEEELEVYTMCVCGAFSVKHANAPQHAMSV